MAPPRRRPWRRAVFALHGAFGVTAGLLLAFVAATGSLAVFRREIDWLTTPALRVAEAARPVGLDAVRAAADRAHRRAADERLWIVERPEGARFASRVLYRRGERVTELFVDPGTGRVQGEREVGIHRGAVANALRQVHVRLLLGVWGRAFVGALGVCLVATAWAGLALSRRDRGRVLRGRRVIARRHTRLGWATVGFHLLIGTTGAVLGLEVVPGLWRRAFSRAAAAVPAAVPDAAVPDAAVPALPPGALDRAAAVAEAAVAGGRWRALRFDAGGEKATVALDLGAPLVARGACHVRIDLTTGQVLDVVDTRRGAVATRVYDALDPLHFGYFGEVWGTLPGYGIRALWCLAGFSPAGLFFTGLALWRRRSRSLVRG